MCCAAYAGVMSVCKELDFQDRIIKCGRKKDFDCNIEVRTKSEPECG
jgi:hypothetical protein